MPSEMDDRDFPVIRLRAIGTSSDDDIRERLRFLDRQLARGRTLSLVFDTRRSSPLTAVQRKMWHTWLEKNEPLIRRHVAGVAILVGSAAIRGVFTAIFWAWKPMVPVVFVGTDEEAERVVRQQIGRGVEGR